MKVLLFSCSTGGGHNSAAAALAQELEARNVENRTYDACNSCPSPRPTSSATATTLPIAMPPKFTAQAIAGRRSTPPACSMSRASGASAPCMRS